MGISSFASAQWAVTTVIEVFLLVLALRHKLLRRLPFFTIYLWILVANELITWTVYSVNGIASPASFYVYWTMQAVQIAARALAVYDICRALLASYTGIWKMCRPLLIFLAAILIVGATISTNDSAHHLAAAILAGERGLELTVVGILIGGLIFCRYYGIGIDRQVAWIALGLGFYSAVQVASNTLYQHSMVGHFAIWEDFRHASFNIATIFWVVALWKPLPARQPAPVLLRSGEYDRLAPQMTLRLRELNTRLLEMWK
ncbi:MAG: hypothetical protein ACYDBL_07120 [Candidatus Acidiferrales bacterium]